MCMFTWFRGTVLSPLAVNSIFTRTPPAGRPSVCVQQRAHMPSRPASYASSGHFLQATVQGFGLAALGFSACGLLMARLTKPR